MIHSQDGLIDPSRLNALIRTARGGHRRASNRVLVKKPLSSSNGGRGGRFLVTTDRKVVHESCCSPCEGSREPGLRVQVNGCVVSVRYEAF